MSTLIKNCGEFKDWLSHPVEEGVSSLKEKRYYTNSEDNLEITNLDSVELNLKEKYFYGTNFTNCTFISCKFEKNTFFCCEFKNCKFTECQMEYLTFVEAGLTNVEFESCVVVDLNFADCLLNDLLFTSCKEVLDVRFRSGYEKRKVTFFDCDIAFLDIEPKRNVKEESFKFIDSILRESSFDRINLSTSEFSQCSLSLNQFSSCTFSNETFDPDNKCPAGEYNLADIRTFTNSEALMSSTLESLFGIHNSEIKDYLIELTSKLSYQSIFISYSFKDKEFANMINTALIKRGIFTFIWENDAPGGKKLTDIMSDNIKRNDRVLFIASKNSLKSKACHYELSEGRIKQDSLWEDVLFPIHIDNFLFTVKEDSIRPKEVKDEYWMNIQELKGLNSIDFSNWKNLNRIDMDSLVSKLVKGLIKH